MADPASEDEVLQSIFEALKALNAGLVALIEQNPAGASVALVRVRRSINSLEKHFPPQGDWFRDDLQRMIDEVQG